MHTHARTHARPQPQHQSEIYRLKGSLLAAMDDAESAHHAFFVSLHLWKKSADAWLGWGKVGSWVAP